MTTTPNLLIEHIAANQAQKEVTANAAFDALDKATCQLTTISLADADLTLTDAQLLASFSLRLTGTLTAARTVTVPARAKLVLVENATTGGYILNIKTPSGTAIALNPGDRKLLYNNGTTLLIVAEFSSLGGLPYDIGGTIVGQPAGGAILLRYPAPRAIRFPSGMVGSRGVAGTAAASSATFSIRKNGTQFATMQFASGASTATFTAASDMDFSAGDILSMVSPSPADINLADIGFALAGVRL